MLHKEHLFRKKKALKLFEYYLISNFSALFQKLLNIAARYQFYPLKISLDIMKLYDSYYTNMCPYGKHIKQENQMKDKGFTLAEILMYPWYNRGLLQL